MATDLHFVEYVLEQSRLGRQISSRKMFGEYALYLSGKVVAFVCDNSLFIKLTDATASMTTSLPQGLPYPGARPHAVGDALLDEPELLHALLLATEEALPLPKPKQPKKVIPK